MTPIKYLNATETQTQNTYAVANPGKVQIMFLGSNIDSSKITFMIENKKVKSRQPWFYRTLLSPITSFFRFLRCKITLKQWIFHIRKNPKLITKPSRFFNTNTEILLQNILQTHHITKCISHYKMEHNNF